MVMEVLKYRAPSKVLELEQVVLEPELTQDQFYFLAEIADSHLMAETFYRLHRITTIKTGRVPGHETRVRYSYDPIITVDNGFVDFETFSLDMCYYAKARFYEDAFKNVEHWDCGVTNVDFSKPFIKQVREAKKLKNLFVDPEGLEVMSDEKSLIEKKIPLPENWKIALENIQTHISEIESTSCDYRQSDIQRKIPFNPYLRRFAKISRSCTSPKGWNFIEMEMRKQLGLVQIIVTPNQLERIDGRHNINYEIIRRNRNLRRVKSFYLDVEKIDGDTYRVSGGRKPHIVKYVKNQYVCDCGDYVYRHNRNCKHIRAINRPKLVVFQENNNTWLVSDGTYSCTVMLKGNKFVCECGEFKRTNVCQHFVEVLKFLEDYQYKEVKKDFS